MLLSTGANFRAIFRLPIDLRPNDRPARLGQMPTTQVPLQPPLVLHHHRRSEPPVDDGSRQFSLRILPQPHSPSDGDFQLLEWVTSAPGARLGMIVHHDDAEREFAYDRQSHVGRLNRALDEAGPRGWTVVSMKHDWAAVYSPH